MLLVRDVAGCRGRGRSPRYAAQALFSVPADDESDDEAGEASEDESEPDDFSPDVALSPESELPLDEEDPLEL